MAIQSSERQARIAKLVASDAWRRLRSQQKTWMMDFIHTADETHAARAAYPKASERSLLVMRYEIRRAKHIRAALAVWNGSGTSTQEDFDRLYIENQQLRAGIVEVHTKALLVIERILADKVPVLMKQESNIFWRELAQKASSVSAN